MFNRCLHAKWTEFYHLTVRNVSHYFFFYFFFLYECRIHTVEMWSQSKPANTFTYTRTSKTHTYIACSFKFSQWVTKVTKPKIFTATILNFIAGKANIFIKYSSVQCASSLWMQTTFSNISQKCNMIAL